LMLLTARKLKPIIKKFKNLRLAEVFKF